MSTGDFCVCGHARDWHAHHGTRACEHDGDCKCVAFTTGDHALRWEPGSLSSRDLDRVLTDALADLFADCYRRDDVTWQVREFRERLERAVEHATGVPLAGLPARFPSSQTREPVTRDIAREALAHAFGDAYEQGNGTPDYNAAEIALGALERESIGLARRADTGTVNPAGTPTLVADGLRYGEPMPVAGIPTDQDVARAKQLAADIPVSREEFDEPVPLAAVPRRRHPLNEAGHKRGDAA